jgi:signal peptidase II
MTPKQAFALGAFAISLPLDLLTKWIVERNLSYSDRIPVIEGFFYLTHVRNPGAAFGLFADGDPQIRLLVFIAVSIVAVGIILSFFRQLAPGTDCRRSRSAHSRRRRRQPARSDLSRRGGRLPALQAVARLHWPDFNLADSFIVVGVRS